AVAAAGFAGGRVPGHHPRRPGVPGRCPGSSRRAGVRGGAGRSAAGIRSPAGGSVAGRAGASLRSTRVRPTRSAVTRLRPAAGVRATRCAAARVWPTAGVQRPARVRAARSAAGVRSTGRASFDRTRWPAGTERAGMSMLRTLRAEQIKLTTLRSTWWSMALTLGASLVSALLIAGAVTEDSEGTTVENIATLFVVAVLLALIALMAMAVIVSTSEYRFGQIRMTLAATPHRWLGLLANAVGTMV